MRVLIINTDYQGCIDALYRDEPGLSAQSYVAQHAARMATLAGTADFLSGALSRLGVEAWDVIANIEPMQRRWAQEHRVKVGASERWGMRLRRGVVPWPDRQRSRQWISDILAAQIRHDQPDVIYSMALETVDSELLRRVRGSYGIAIGQHAAPMPQGDVTAYDLIYSSLPNQVEAFSRMGVESRYLPLAFEPRVLESIEQRDKRHDVVFVGGLSRAHQRGWRLLEQCCRHFDTAIWGYGIEQVPAGSPIHDAYRGPAWGRQMYQHLAEARIVLNRHIEDAGDYANNMRLYEATGVGSLLLTEPRRNLHELFTPGLELDTYRDLDECLEKIAQHLKHGAERERIAEAGQHRTLTSHTYDHRAHLILAEAQSRIEHQPLQRAA